MVLLQYATCAGVQKCADIHHPYAGIVLHLVTGGKLSGWQCAVLGNSGTLVVLVTFTTKKTKSENNWPCIYKCFATDGTLKSPTCHINTVIPYLIHWASYDKLSVHLATITCTIAILYSALRVCCKLYSLWEISLHTAWVNLLQQVTIKGIAYNLQYLLPIMHTYAHMHKQHINSTSLFTFTLACSLVHSIN